MDLGLKDRVVLVTGGSRGLGRAICLGLAGEGARIGVNYSANCEAADSVVKEIAKLGGTAIALGADISKSKDVTKLFAQLEKAFGPVNALVNNAGISPPGMSITEIKEDDWDRIFEINMRGTFLCSREFVRRTLAAKRSGKIVNISSQAAFRGSQSGKLAYDSSKGAILSFTVGLAVELAAKGIQVNCVAPGLMRTEMLAALIDANPDKFNGRVPMKRVGLPEEIARTVTFLCGSGSDYMTGATVDVSGGLAMH
jgi:3-oxoacyl-[acyl-carrier protein] reductase